MILENTDSLAEAIPNEDMAESRTEKNNYNADIVKEKLFELGNVLGRAVTETL